MLPETSRLRLTFAGHGDFEHIWRLQRDPDVMRYIRTADTHPAVVHKVTTADGTPLCVVFRGPEYPELERRLAEAASAAGARPRLRR